MGRSAIETLMGAVVILVAAMFVFISYKSGNIASGSDTYKVVAKFRQIGSLAIGSDVRVGGIKVGTVSGQRLDPQNYKAVVEMGIDDNVKLPKDSSASVIGDGLLGGKYIAIEPGGAEDYIGHDGEIHYTQDAVSLEDLIGKFAFGSVGDDQSAKPNSGDAAPGGLLDE